MTGHTNTKAAIVALALALSVLPNALAAQVLARHADWTAFAHDDGTTKLCFAATQPKERQPATARRDPPHFYITSWPKTGTKAEVSIKLGYPVKKGSTVTVSIDTKPYKLFAEADRAFVADVTEEAAIVEALKKGRQLSVQATSERGTVTVDTYSLAGVTQALQAAMAACP